MFGVINKKILLDLESLLIFKFYTYIARSSGKLNTEHLKTFMNKTNFVI